jgi:uncharacterized protein YcaQ
MPASLLSPRISLTAREARTIALSAQGFGRRRTAAVSPWPHARAAIEDMALLQLDSVNVLVRSHYLPVFSRIGNYDRAALDRRAFASGGRRELFEYWAHEASLLPLSLHPLMRWRMARARRLVGVHASHAEWVRGARGYIRAVKRELADRGPLAAADLSDPGERSGPWWGWHKGKAALEYLFRTGEVTTAGRRGAFERVYDLTERAIKAEVLGLPTPPEADAVRELAAIAGRAFGIATEIDIRDYFRLPVAEARKAIGELVEEGVLQPAFVQGWDRPAYLVARPVPQNPRPTALLSPFDPLVWFRPRTERLFGFHYRIEIYTPQHKRKFGYYVLPFLHAGRLRARVDVKAARSDGVLDVLGAHAEAGVDPGDLGPDLALELQRLAGWLGLGGVRVAPQGDLAQALRNLV